MEYIIKYFSRAKAWELFFIMTLTPFVFSLLQLFNTPDLFENFWKLMIVPSLLAIVYMSWIWSMGIRLAKIKKVSSARKKLFNYAVIYNYLFVTFNVFFYLLFPNIINAASQTIFLIGVIINVSCTVYAIAYLSKLICGAESSGKGLFNNIIITFLLILYFPVGVWFVQPRIIRILGGKL